MQPGKRRRRSRENLSAIQSDRRQGTTPARMEALKGLHSTFRGLFDRLEVRLKQDRKQAEDDLEAHFHAVETVLFQTALPSISPRVKYSLQRFCDVSALLAALKQPAGDAGDSDPPRSKLEVWQDLKVLSFARAAAAVSSLAVVSMQMRLMLTVLSRQLFLERAMEGVAGEAARGLNPTLGIEAQEFFLSLVERGFVTTGMGTMVEALKATAATIVGNLALAETMDASRTRATFAALGEKVARRVRRGDFVSEPIDETESETRTKNFWRDALLPPDETVVSAFRERFGAGADDAVLALLLTMAREVRTVASTRVFADALGDATARAWDRFAADAEASLFRDGEDETDADGGEGGAESVSKTNKLPVAKLVPAVSNLAGQTLSHPLDAFGAVASCPKVQELTREMW